MKKLLFPLLLLVLLNWCCPAIFAQQCKLEVSPSQKVVKANKVDKIFLKVGLTGFEMQADKPRTPLNIALVLDRSGSMAGEKIEQLKKAALASVDLLKEEDILSVVAYSTAVEVLVPATKVTDKEMVRSKIRGITATQTTALYAGTEAGAKEVEKFLSKDRVNRVVLLSDGLANVGPSTPAELKELGRQLGGKGISVTTFGLGDDFNEELMIQLASASDGNHTFITKATNLTEVFADEFNLATMVVAQEVTGQLKVPQGVKIIRSLNMPVEIDGQTAFFNWKQIYSALQRYAIFELEFPAGEDTQIFDLAAAEISYMNMATQIRDTISAAAQVSYSNSVAKTEESIDRAVRESAVLQLANLANAEATKLRDAGDREGARRVLSENVDRLRTEERKMGGSVRLKEAAELNNRQSNAISGSNEAWSSTGRKDMRANQRATGAQQFASPVK